jgi:MFS family permease
MVYSSLPPYLIFMIQDFQITKDPNKVGYYSGLFSFSYFIMQFMTCFVYGLLSDKYGRRKVILMSTFGITITTFLFSISRNFYWALGMRLLFGFVNGNVTTLKTYISEISSEKNQGMVFF